MHNFHIAAARAHTLPLSESKISPLSLVLQRPNTPQNKDFSKEIKLTLRSGGSGAYWADYVAKTTVNRIVNISCVLNPKTPLKMKIFPMGSS